MSFTRLGTSVQILDAMASVLCARADEIKDEHIHKFRKSFDDKLRAAERAREVCEAALATFDMRAGIEIPAADAAKDAGRGTAA